MMRSGENRLPPSHQARSGLKRFQAKWQPVRVKKTRQMKNLEPRFDSIVKEPRRSRHRHYERKRSNPLDNKEARVDCFGRFAPRNDVKLHLRNLAARYARVLRIVPSGKKRAQGMPGAQRARSLACKIKKHTS